MVRFESQRRDRIYDSVLSPRTKRGNSNKLMGITCYKYTHNIWQTDTLHKKMQIASLNNWRKHFMETKSPWVSVPSPRTNRGNSSRLRGHLLLQVYTKYLRSRHFAHKKCKFVKKRHKLDERIGDSIRNLNEGNFKRILYSILSFRAMRCSQQNCRTDQFW